MGCVTAIQPMDHGIVSGMVSALATRYPFLYVAPIGHSVLGRKLWGMTLGGGRNRVLMAAAFHGQEWMTAWVCLRLCEELCRALSTDQKLSEWDIRRAMSGRGIVFVPMVNPDGVEIALHGSHVAGEHRAAVHDAGGDVPGRWQANANGVDINHNFNAGWEELQQQEAKKGITGFSARQWGGPRPTSEPETQALVGLCERARFRHVVALHSQGEEIYWNYGDTTPPESEMMAKAMASASGYAVSTPIGLASHGGFKDWFIQTYSRPGFTVELGRGENPLPLCDFKKIYEKAREMLLVSLFL